MSSGMVSECPRNIDEEFEYLNHTVLVPGLIMAAYTACLDTAIAVAVHYGLPFAWAAALLVVLWVLCAYAVVPSVLPSGLPERERVLYARMAPLTFLVGTLWGLLTASALVACFICMPLKWKKGPWVYLR